MIWFHCHALTRRPPCRTLLIIFTHTRVVFSCGRLLFSGQISILVSFTHKPTLRHLTHVTTSLMVACRKQWFWLRVWFELIIKQASASKSERMSQEDEPNLCTEIEYSIRQCLTYASSLSPSSSDRSFLRHFDKSSRFSPWKQPCKMTRARERERWEKNKKFFGRKGNN